MHMESFEYKGIWWLPGRSSRDKIGGTISFDAEDGLMLDLVGSFQPSPQIIDSKAVKIIPIILGTTDSGKEITLHRCFQQQGRIGTHGFTSAKYWARNGFVGKHFT